MSIELRSWINFQPYLHGLSTRGIARQAEYFSGDQLVVSADPDHIATEAREYEASGYDSSIVPQSASWPDAWSTVTWALAHTQRLKVIAAHRPGVTQPAAAARTFATVDRLSKGRAGVHVIMGHFDRQADGDQLDQGAVYARAEEYLEIFDRTLREPEPFDFSGDFYTVRGAWSGVRPLQQPRPVLSLPVGSEQSIGLAARHADVFALRGQSLAEAQELIGRVSVEAQRIGRERELRAWANFNVIVDTTDDDAWRRARQIEAGVIELADHRRRTKPRHTPDFNEGRPVRHSDGPEVLDRALWTGLSRLTSTELTFVGSPTTVADAILDYHDLGIEIFTLGSHVTNPVEEEARRELLRLLHEAAEARDRVGAFAGSR
ncbi:LLM class flavin-dependent oxidoreductase [Conexibacter stalactiti]|uniref:LLM class flavin-dependent oxidoreductase n=1 Tax=Conexibacter stalactiti TaxID=1940611 RepID=A0ABU4HNK3_9ACTN|nr:LLM class flavin-dependent oxidoreductase [Conexibacter stalactiti]MDW5594277.1 LLM class flavin-dependent oxidoreductase [Conexibacter stalactiti]MEC5034919.1 LLM class flavin-dependent oxidoreductase [Conexibacter stalactiti]